MDFLVQSSDADEIDGRGRRGGGDVRASVRSGNQAAKGQTLGDAGAYDQSVPAGAITGIHGGVVGPGGDPSMAQVSGKIFRVVAPTRSRTLIRSGALGRPL